MINVTQFYISILPENAQTELYDFYLFLKQRYTKIDAIFPRKLSNTMPFTRDEVYEQ